MRVGEPEAAPHLFWQRVWQSLCVSAGTLAHERWHVAATFAFVCEPRKPQPATANTEAETTNIRTLRRMESMLGRAP